MGYMVSIKIQFFFFFLKWFNYNNTFKLIGGIKVVWQTHHKQDL